VPDSIGSDEFKYYRFLESMEYNLLTVGKTNNEIADFLKITEGTIETHVANIYSKLQVINRIELINFISEFN
jgi:DNA-binding NarL/FixJ family response regulator